MIGCNFAACKSIVRQHADREKQQCLPGYTVALNP